LIVNRKVFAWALYDWANSAFALSVLAVLFPLFLGSYWSAGDDGASVTARLAWITAGASAVVSVLAPIFGTIADEGGYRKRFLLILALLGATMTASLALVGEGNWPWALTLYLDSLIIDVTKPDNYKFVSSFGFSLGYLGGAVLLALHVWMLTSPATFGLASVNEAMKFAFISVGVWWAVFLIPLIVFVPESKRGVSAAGGAVRAAYKELRDTFTRIRRYRNISMFLLGYWFYIGGVFTVIFMAANFGQRLGFGQQDLVKALMITNFVGFPATLLYAFLGHRFGSKPGIFFALAVYIVVSAWAGFMTDVSQFYVLAIVIGCVQGGVQGLSRSLYASLIPVDQPGEFFGFYNMVTKLSHVLGPVIVGIAATFSDEPRFVLLVLIPLFILGAILLRQIPADSSLSDHRAHIEH
jgi:UMF1 family MFS transporter